MAKSPEEKVLKRAVVSRQILILAAILFFGALMIRLAALPLQKSLERDSLGYIALAQTDLKKAAELPNGEANAKMRSRMTVFIYLLKIGPHLGLSTERWGHILNIFAGSVAAVIIAGIALLLFQDLRAAWFAGLLAAAEPVSVRYSLSILREPLAFTLAAAAIFMALLWFRRKQRWFWALLSGVFSACATLIRMEMIESLVFFWLLLLIGGIFRKLSLKSIGSGLAGQLVGGVILVAAIDFAIQGSEGIGILSGIRQTFCQYCSRILG